MKRYRHRKVRWSNNESEPIDIKVRQTYRLLESRDRMWDGETKKR